MKAWLLAAIALPLLAAGSAAPQPVPNPLDSDLRQARAEQAAAEAETAKLEQAAAQARDEATRLRARQEAAAQAIEAAEARITASDAELRLASAYVAAHRQQLAEQQRPIASLLAGLATMAERPPLLALADRGGTDELVKVRILLDSTLPVIRQRTARLSSELAQGQKLEQAALAARADLVRGQQNLAAKRQQFAGLEQRAIERSLASGGQALGAGDVAIAASEDVERLRASEASSRDAFRLASQLASADPAPPRPSPPEGGPVRLVQFAYALPANARVVDGLGSVNDSGVQSRGLTLATGRGMPLVAPASGTVRFAGPYGDHDGILIIDHGGGWMSLIVNVASTLRPGNRVQLGDPIGRALGPVGVELSQNGRRISPALIAGSSPTLSKAGKGG
jgi:septal ring factor EnvC (AmiA/AmiB activator)